VRRILLDKAMRPVPGGRSERFNIVQSVAAYPDLEQPILE
jgi:hypothetical protein